MFRRTLLLVKQRNKNRRVKSAFGSSLKDKAFAEKEQLKSSDNDDLESRATKATKATRATKATKGFSSEISNRIGSKIASFSEEDMNKIMESIRNNTPSMTKIDNWREFAEQQLEHARGHRSKHEGCYACNNEFQ